MGGGAWAVPDALPPFAPPALVGPSPLDSGLGDDPIHVFYPRAHCEGSHLQLEIWDRNTRTWSAHPEHPRVRLESCQLEDAGRLLNELRWRCDEPGRHTAWNVGLDVFDPGITESCAVAELRGPEYHIDIHVSAPSRSTVVRSLDRMATLRGSVRIDGLVGTAYDVLIAIDRSGEGERDRERLAAQLRAARELVEELRPRLGTVQIGFTSYPNSDPPPGETRKGRLELPLTGDGDLLLRALDRIEERGIAGKPAFADGFEHGLNQLLLLAGGNRPAARRVLVLAADGHAAPFVSEEAGDPVRFMRLDGLAAEARRSGVRLHMLALGGYAEAPTALVEDVVARSLGRFERVPTAALAGPFFSSISLPRPSSLQVTSALAGTRSEVEIDADGNFAIRIPLEGGLNRLRLRAQTSDERTQERDWIVDYDESQYLELVLEAERDRVARERQAQRKALDVRAEPLPEVGAGPQ